MSRCLHRGFTLIELMIVVTIIGILAAIAIPKFSTLIAKGHEASTKGNLGALRGALSIYYGNCEGIYPSDDLHSLAVGNTFIPILPAAMFPATANSAGHKGGGTLSGVLTGSIPGGSNDASDNVSGWLYDNSESDDGWGRVIANCTHSDYYARAWSSF